MRILAFSEASGIVIARWFCVPICAGTQGVCMTKRILILLALSALAVFCTVPAMADTMASGTLTLTNCGTLGTGCPAATYSFVVTSTSATLTIAINGGLNLTNDNLTAVDLGFTDANNTITFGTPAFTTSGNAGGTWNAATGSLNSGGECGTNGGAFVCASISPLNGLTLQQGQTYTFTWNYTLANPNGIFAAGDVHIGAEYGPNQGNYKGLIVSQTIPEPTSLTLLGAGLLALGGLARRRALKD